jgi:hypothetical protein
MCGIFSCVEGWNVIFLGVSAIKLACVGMLAFLYKKAVQASAELTNAIIAGCKPGRLRP